MRAAGSTAGQSTAGAGNTYYDPSQSANYNANEEGSYNRRNYSYEAQSKFTLIRNCINAGNITEAERLLSEIDKNDRGAEWHFLLGCVLMRKGFYVDAQREFDTAYRMEPTNNEYFRFKEQLRQQSAHFGGGYNTQQTRGGCCDMDICTSLICADCCCECMGGDLISCC
jgi:tetratricopeptide (TPR) repeat protein